MSPFDGNIEMIYSGSLVFAVRFFFFAMSSANLTHFYRSHSVWLIRRKSYSQFDDRCPISGHFFIFESKKCLFLIVIVLLSILRSFLSTYEVENIWSNAHSWLNHSRIWVCWNIEPLCWSGICSKRVRDWYNFGGNEQRLAYCQLMSRLCTSHSTRNLCGVDDVLYLCVFCFLKYKNIKNEEQCGVVIATTLNIN